VHTLLQHDWVVYAKPAFSGQNLVVRRKWHFGALGRISWTQMRGWTRPSPRPATSQQRYRSVRPRVCLGAKNMM
jgi:hypothetical protein